MRPHMVFLVPGFFGFTSVGAVSYFEDVERALQRGLQVRGIDARIVRCKTQPTASIRRRAEALRRQVLASGGLRAQALHFVGHSTGGLDVRLLLTPGLRGTPAGRSPALPDAAAIGRLTRSAVTVATPHHGTPLANRFVSLQGQTLLLVLTALATTGQGHGLIVAAAKALALVAEVDDWFGRPDGPLDRLARGVLDRMRLDRRDAVWRYLRAIERDQGAVLQLTPEGMDLFQAAVADHPDVAYGCVVTGVPAPRESLTLGEITDPEYLTLRALFRLLHGLTAPPHRHYPYPEPDADTQVRLIQALGFVPGDRSNDGIVPTRSQLHGRLLHAARADHLDVVGHSGLAGGRTADWLPSGAGFTPAGFDAAWDAVAAAIAGAGTAG